MQQLLIPSLKQTHCIVFYDKRQIKLTGEEFQKVEIAMEDQGNQKIKLHGAFHAIADMKYVGPLIDAPRHLDPNYIPPGQKDNFQENHFGQFLASGNVQKLPPNIREKAEKQFEEHIKLHPVIDKMLAKKRLDQWKSWKKMANLDPEDVRNSVPAFVCHDGYTFAETEIFHKYKIKFCAGQCYDQCSYLKT